MVDEALINEVKEKLDAGAAATDISFALKMYELFKQIAMENEDLKEELEDMDITVQMIVTDVDTKAWMKAHDGILEYGEGETDNPSFTFSANKEVALGLIRLYQLTISQVTPSSCRFIPTCSQYTYETITKYGLLKGVWLGARRLARCHPFHPGGYDPVP